jgi:hypothetical protein
MNVIHFFYYELAVEIVLQVLVNFCVWSYMIFSVNSEKNI